MSEEIKTPEPLLPRETPTDEAPAQTLTEELNALRDIFQREWDRASQEADDGFPPIQALDYSPEPDGDADEANPETEELSDTPTEEKKKRIRKPKGASKGALLLLIVCMVLLLIPLLTFFILSVSIPNFNSFLNAYGTALSADTDEEKLKSYTLALSYCTVDGDDDGANKNTKTVPLIGRFEQRILENVTVLTCKTDSYAAARSFMNAHFTDKMKAKPKTEEFRSFLKLGDALPPIADAIYTETAAALDTAGTPDGVDLKALMTKLSVPALLQKDVSAIAEALAGVIAAERAAEDEGELARVFEDYVTVGAAFEPLGVRPQTLMEITAVKCWEHGYLDLTEHLINNYFTAEELAAPKTEAFKALYGDINEIRAADGLNLYARLAKLYESGKTDDASVTAALREVLSESAAETVAETAGIILKGVGADRNRDLTLAKKSFGKAYLTLETLGVTDGALILRLTELYLATGDTDTAHTLREKYVTDDALAAVSNETKAAVRKADAMYAAKEKAFAVFSAHYDRTLKTVDRDALLGELKALADGSADPYLAAYCNYYSFEAEALSDMNRESMIGYLTACALLLPDDPFVYGAPLVKLCILSGDYETAAAYTDRMYAVTISDDFTTAAKAKLLRIDGKTDNALGLAAAGIRFSGVYYACAHEAAIGYLLKGDFSAALENAAGIFDAGNADRADMELLILLDALYAGNDDQLKNRLNAYKEKAAAALTDNHFALSDAAKAVVEGTKTAEELFLSAPYDLTYERSGS